MILDSKGRPLKRKMGFVKGYEREPEPASEPVDLVGELMPESEEPENTEDE